MKFYRRIKQSLIHWLAHRLPHCEQLVPVISESMDRRLGLRQRLILKLHLFFCTECVRYLRHLRLLRGVVRSKSLALPGEDSSATSLSAEARGRILRALYSRKKE